MRVCIHVAAIVALAMALLWGVTALVQASYVDGYETAKAAYHG